MTRVYAFDFDGVIADSAKGWAFFCRKAWKKLGNKKAPSIRDIKINRHYIKDAKESYGLLVLLSKNAKISRAAVKKEVVKDTQRAKEFSEKFFLEKNNFIKENEEKFCELYSVYPFVVPFLKDILKREKVYIVTNNKRNQVLPVLKNTGIEINEDLVLGGSSTLDKKAHIKTIAEKEKIDTKDIVFVEDSIEHLMDVMSTGIQPVLASWGYVLDEDVKQAKKLGMTILDKNNIFSLLTTGNQEEIFDVVDENNKVVGKATRKEAHTKGLLHRAVHILIVNSKGQVLLQKRSMTKDLYKGYWIDAAAGHVDSGESYESSARRELKEELGISTKLEALFDCKKYTGNDNEIIRVFLGKHNGPFKAHKEEVDFVRFFGPKTILKMMKTENFTPATITIFEEIRKRPELLKSLGLS